MKRRLICTVVLTACALFLSSCKVGDALLSSLGFDTYDYEGEAVIRTVEPDSREAEDLCKMIKILSVNSPYMPEFDSATQALKQCRDSVLNYMLCTDFSMYTGNPELMKEAEEKYPGLRILTVIPAEDFENCVYTFFGGNAKLTHKSSQLFTYLDEVSAYTAISVPVESNVAVSVISCEETEKTYRLTFQNTLGEVTSPVYKTLVVKREDGSMYFKYLEKIETN